MPNAFGTPWHAPRACQPQLVGLGAPLRVWHVFGMRPTHAKRVWHALACTPGMPTPVGGVGRPPACLARVWHEANACQTRLARLGMHPGHANPSWWGWAPPCVFGTCLA